ncbi:MAG: hypothetical protein NTV49_13365, partial [Kiritimatiellaeota bacterium]|nr:hypothetical protein [Kiritimatiellota bacterium]
MGMYEPINSACMSQNAGIRILLTTVCKPYGVPDKDAEALGMQMELLNNQLTREQHVHSPRASFWTFPLYFLAENISVPATVLDFPSWHEFKRELRKGYTHVGVSFIQTNVLKAKRMAEYVRAHHPTTKILLGGYGSSLPDLAELVPHDAVCPGEGVRWLRAYFGEDPAAPIHHPVMHGVISKHLYGLRGASTDSAVMFPGLGCTNGCFFCATSAKFGKQYIPLLPTGRSVFDLCHKAEEELGVREFAVIDENFLKAPERARELLREMEREGRSYHFWIFASAEAILQLGVDFLVRLGVCAVWMGLETREEIFGKLRGIDVRGLIRELQSKGISVMSSSILFMEHHDRKSLHDDIEWAVDMDTDLHQFMQLTPLPGTPLYERYKSEGKLIPEFPYTRLSGQNALAFYHPHFRSEEARDLTRRAFQRKYKVGGPGIVNMARTAIDGYERAMQDFAARKTKGLCWDPDTLQYNQRNGHVEDRYMLERIRFLRQRATEFRPILLSAWLFSPNLAARRKCLGLITRHRRLFGRTTVLEKLAACLLSVTA